MIRIRQCGRKLEKFKFNFSSTAQKKLQKSLYPKENWVEGDPNRRESPAFAQRAVEA